MQAHQDDAGYLWIDCEVLTWSWIAECFFRCQGIGREPSRTREAGWEVGGREEEGDRVGEVLASSQGELHGLHWMDVSPAVCWARGQGGKVWQWPVIVFLFLLSLSVFCSFFFSWFFFFFLCAVSGPFTHDFVPQTQKLIKSYVVLIMA